jgi:ketosteroid isomerase-like protein
MSRENVEIVRRVFDAASRRDSATVLALYDPEVEWDYSRGPFRDLFGGEVYHGHEGARRFFREYYAPETWQSVEDNLEELIDAGDHVVSVVNTRARGRASGASVEWTHNAGVWTIREGKVMRVAWFGSVDEALEAVGLRE